MATADVARPLRSQRALSSLRSCVECVSRSTQLKPSRIEGCRAMLPGCTRTSPRENTDERISRPRSRDGASSAGDRISRPFLGRMSRLSLQGLGSISAKRRVYASVLLLP